MTTKIEGCLMKFRNTIVFVISLAMLLGITTSVAQATTVVKSSQSVSHVKAPAEKAVPVTALTGVKTTGGGCNTSSGNLYGQFRTCISYDARTEHVIADVYWVHNAHAQTCAFVLLQIHFKAYSIINGHYLKSGVYAADKFPCTSGHKVGHFITPFVPYRYYAVAWTRNTSHQDIGISGVSPELRIVKFIRADHLVSPKATPSTMSISGRGCTPAVTGSYGRIKPCIGYTPYEGGRSYGHVYFTQNKTKTCYVQFRQIIVNQNDVNDFYYTPVETHLCPGPGKSMDWISGAYIVQRGFRYSVEVRAVPKAGTSIVWTKSPYLYAD